VISSEFEEIRTLVDQELERFLPALDQPPCSLHEAMRYSVFAGGKRLRPALVLLSNRACVGDEDAALPAACALELVHTYSLIHDDLPAMDDDDLRRGKPTCHKQFGEAVAILAGDALLTLAFELVAPMPAAAKELAGAAGSLGMIAGQVADMEAEGAADTCSPEELKKKVEYIHRHKTAALIRAAARMGAVLASAGSAQLAALSRYGECLGLAFQVTDDILDMTGTEERMGKAVGKDIRRGKLVHPLAFGLEESKAKAKDLIVSAKEALELFLDKAEPLNLLADFVLTRSE
jgi:geranylgeranyl diphosphate synthase type II